MDYQHISINIILPVPFLILGPGEQHQRQATENQVVTQNKTLPDKGCDIIQQCHGMETEAVEVPAERSGAACPDGAVTDR